MTPGIVEHAETIGGLAVVRRARQRQSLMRSAAASCKSTTR